MKIMNHLFKAVIGIIGSLVTIGCAHVEEKQKTTDVPTDALTPAPTDNNEINYELIDTPDAYEAPPVYGPPENYEPISEPLPESKRSAKTVYGPPPAPLKLSKRDISSDILFINRIDNHWEITLHVGYENEIKKGDTGELYYNNQPLEHGRIKITNVTKSRCKAITDATVDEIPERTLKRATVIFKKRE